MCMDVTTKPRAERHTVPVTRKPMNPHQYRIRDEDYALAMQAADERQENLSEEVRKFVIKYGRKHAKKEGQS